MKKLFLLSLMLFLTFGIISCSTEGFDEEREDYSSLSSILNSDGFDIDLSDISCNEDAQINKSKKIKNGDFNGKTLTVNSGDVTLENVKNIVIVISPLTSGKVNLENCSDVKIITINGGTELNITDSTVEQIDIRDDDFSLNLENDTNVEKINVSKKGTAINSETTGESEKAPVISELNVAPDVDNVDVAGGKIENVVINETGSESAPTVTVTGGITIEKVESKDEAGTILPTGSIVVSDKAKDEVVLPENVTPLSIVSVVLAKGEGVKYSYEVGDVFDYTDLAVKITYSDNTEKTVMMNKLNSVVSGFNTNEPGTCTLSFKYNDIAVEGTIDVTITETTKEWKSLLNQGIELICEGQFDEGFTKIKLAYNNEKNDETKMYYSLVELASISTDESVNKIMKENLGITNYPSEFNSLISGDWLEKYNRSRTLGIIELVDVGVYNAESNFYGYVKVDGEWCDSNDENYWIRPPFFLYEGSWLHNYSPEFNKQIKNITITEEGRYLVRTEDIPNIPEGTKIYGCEWTNEEKEFLYEYAYDYYPQFNVPVWLEDTEMYKDSFVGTTATIVTQAYRFYASLIDCNPNGANELIDNIVNVFNTKFNPVKEIANTISNNSVYIPAKVIQTLNLEEFLGDSNVKLGKAELNAVIASLQLFKGIFEWISSYDLSMNITELKSMFTDDYDSLIGTKIPNVKTFTVRSESAMATSKATFIDALEMLLDSYNFIVSSENDYPQAAKDEIKKYGDVLKSACNQLKNSISNGTTFYIPNDSPFETSEWNATKDNCWFGIDMGKLFKAGYFSNIVERTSSGSIKLVCDIKADTKENGYVKLETFEFASDMTAESLEEKCLQLGQAAYPDAYEYQYRISLVLNTDLLDDLLPGLGLNNHDEDGNKISITGDWVDNPNQ